MHNWVKFAEHEDQTSVVSAALLPLLLLQSPELPYRKQELQNIYFLSKLWFTLSVFTISTVFSAECVCSSQMRRCSFMTLRFSRWYGLEEKTKTCPTMLTTQTVTYMHIIQLCTTHFGTRCCTWNLQTTASVIEVLLILAAEPQEMTLLQIDVGLLIWVRHNSPFLQ